MNTGTWNMILNALDASELRSVPQIAVGAYASETTVRRYLPVMIERGLVVPTRGIPVHATGKQVRIHTLYRRETD